MCYLGMVAKKRKLTTPQSTVLARPRIEGDRDELESDEPPFRKCPIPEVGDIIQHVDSENFKLKYIIVISVYVNLDKDNNIYTEIQGVQLKDIDPYEDTRLKFRTTKKYILINTKEAMRRGDLVIVTDY